MDKRGQSLIEAALVLPCLCVGIFMGVQLICYCHNLTELQRMALVTMDRQSISSRPGIRDYWLFHALWGRHLGEEIRAAKRSAAPWRRHRGISTYRQSGVAIDIRVRSRLLPGAGFTRHLPMLTQESFASSYLEPAISGES